MQWNDIPLDIQQMIYKKAVNIDICKFKYKPKHTNLSPYFTPEQIFEFFQIQSESKGMKWFNHRSLLFSERRSHGIEIMELYSVSSSTNKRKLSRKNMIKCLKMNRIIGYTKLKTRYEIIQALQKM